MWRVTLFYVLGLFFVGFLVPYGDPALFGNPGFIDVFTSSFVIAANLAGGLRFGDFINVVILVSVVFIGLSGVYRDSRTLCALAEQGYAPKIFAYIDRAGRPLTAILTVLACGPFVYITLASTVRTIFLWLIALPGLAALFTWGSTVLAHIRFQAAWKAQGHTTDDLPFRALIGVWRS